jgi:hypothetical protein
MIEDAKQAKLADANDDQEEEPSNEIEPEK